MMALPTPGLSPDIPFIASQTLRYDFPLLPGVQCTIHFQGDLTADHLEQLQDYIGVACKRLREQAGRPKAKVGVMETDHAQPARRRKKDSAEETGK
jgi:hypothetical protein